MPKQWNRRLPDSTIEQIDQIAERNGMTDVQVVVLATDRLHREGKTPMQTVTADDLHTMRIRETALLECAEVQLIVAGIGRRGNANESENAYQAVKQTIPHLGRCLPLVGDAGALQKAILEIKQHLRAWENMLDAGEIPEARKPSSPAWLASCAIGTASDLVRAAQSEAWGKFAPASGLFDSIGEDVSWP